MVNNLSLPERFLALVLQGTDLPDSLYEYVTTHPGPGGRYARAALLHPRTPVARLATLFDAYLGVAPSEWPRDRAQMAADVAVRRRAAGLGALEVLELLRRDLTVAHGPKGRSYWWLTDDLLADRDVVTELLATCDLDIAAEIAGRARGPMLGLALHYWDERFMCDDQIWGRYRAEVCGRIAKAAVGPDKRTRKAAVKALAGMRHDGAVIWALAFIPADKPTKAKVADIAVTRAVLPFLEGRVRGVSQYGCMRAIAATFASRWTATGAAHILAALPHAKPANATMRAIVGTLTTSATARSEHHARTATLGVALAEGTSVRDALEDLQRAPQVADWLLAQLKDHDQVWDVATRALHALEGDRPVEDLVPFLLALSE